MQFTQLFDDDRAVSPVIGVILMVAITVILAAVIGTFVLGMSDQMGDTAPRATFGFDATYDSTTTAYDVTVTHESGAAIEANHLSITGGGTPGTWSTGSDTKVSSGESIDVADVPGGNTLRVVYSSPDSDSTTTLQKFEVPE